MRLPWAVLQVLLLCVLLVPLQAAAETVATQVTVANAAPEALDLNVLPDPGDGTVLVSVTIRDANGADDVRALTLVLTGTEDAVAQDAERVWAQGAQARFEARFPGVGELVSLKGSVVDSAGEVQAILHVLTPPGDPLEAQSLAPGTQLPRPAPAAGLAPLLGAAAIAALLVAGRRRW